MYSLSYSDEWSLLLFCGSAVSGLLFLEALKHYIRKDLGKMVRKYRTAKILLGLFGIKLCEFHFII